KLSGTESFVRFENINKMMRNFLPYFFGWLCSADIEPLIEKRSIGINDFDIRIGLGAFKCKFRFAGCCRSSYNFDLHQMNARLPSQPSLPTSGTNLNSGNSFT